MRLSKSYLHKNVAAFALFSILNFVFIFSTKAQVHVISDKDTSLANKLESAIAENNITSAYTIGFKLADQFNLNKQYDLATLVYNKLAILANQQNKDSLYFSAKHAESYIYLLTGQHDKCAEISQSIISQKDTKHIPDSFLGSAYYMIGFIQHLHFKYDESNLNFFKGLSLFRAGKDTLAIGESHRTIASNYASKSEVDKAISHLIKGISYLEAKDSYLVLNMYQSVLNLFLDQKNVYKAKEYMSKIESFKDRMPNESQSYKYQILKARILYLDKQFEQSDKLMKSSLDYFTHNNIDVYKNTCYLHLANTSLREQEFDLAKNYLDSLHFYRKYLKAKNQKFSYHLIQGKLHHKQGLFSTAEIHLDSAKSSINEKRDLRRMHKYHHAMYQIYKDKNDINRALKELEKYKILDDSIYTLDQNILVNEIEAKYYKDQQAKEIISLNKKQANSMRQLEQHRMSLQISILGLFILGIIAFYIYKLNHKLKSKNVALNTAHSEKDILLREIHHRVKNNLQVISSLLALQSKYIKDDNALSAIKQGQDRVYSMALIHQDLYQSNNLKGVDSKDYFEHLIDNLFDSYNINEENIELNYDVDSIMLDVDTMIPLGLVMNELVSNALKHAFKNQKTGIISVDLKRSEDYLTLKVSDNGKGLKSAIDLEGKSFGYELIKAFARKLKADINVESLNGLSIELKIKNYTTAA